MCARAASACESARACARHLLCARSAQHKHIYGDVLCSVPYSLGHSPCPTPTPAAADDLLMH